eukprot:symbB.v1.2.022217.t2/scaffold1962.1/size110877/3
MYTDCAFENTHPDDGGVWKSPGSMLNDLAGGAVDDLMAKGFKYEPWRNWPFRGVHPMVADPNGGLPPDASRTITKICCEKPMRKCVTIGEPTVVVRSLHPELVLLEGVAETGRLLSSALMRGQRGSKQNNLDDLQVEGWHTIQAKVLLPLQNLNEMAEIETASNPKPEAVADVGEPAAPAKDAKEEDPAAEAKEALAVEPPDEVKKEVKTEAGRRPKVIKKDLVPLFVEERGHGRDGELLRDFIMRKEHLKEDARNLAINRWLIRGEFYDECFQEYLDQYGPGAIEPEIVVDLEEQKEALVEACKDVMVVTKVTKKKVEELEAVSKSADVYALRDTLLAAVKDLTTPRRRLGIPTKNQSLPDKHILHPAFFYESLTYLDVPFARHRSSRYDKLIQELKKELEQNGEIKIKDEVKEELFGESWQDKGAKRKGVVEGQSPSMICLPYKLMLRDDEARDLLKNAQQSRLRKVVLDCLKAIWESGVGGEVLKIALDAVKSRIDRYKVKIGESADVIEAMAGVGAQSQVVRLPKAELHIHLEGAMRPKTLTELCQKHGVARPMDTCGKRFSDFSPFANCYMAVCECLREESDLQRLVLEVAEDAAKSGALWIEPALSIELYADRFGGVQATLELLMRAAEAAETRTGVAMGFIVAAERHLPVPQAEALATTVKTIAAAGQCTIHGRPGIIGFGLHSAEVGHPPEPFAEAFRIACSSDIVALPHAGEFAPAPGQGPASVKFCVDILGARRIAHGVLSMEDEELIQHLAKLQVCLDICPSSNELLGVVPVKESPLTKFLEAGVPCTINSDDPLLFGPRLLDEFKLCRDQLKMSDDLLAACAAFWPAPFSTAVRLQS